MTRAQVKVPESMRPAMRPPRVAYGRPLTLAFLQPGAREHCGSRPLEHATILAVSRRTSMSPAAER